VTVDSRYTPRTAILQYVAGSSWTVSYFSQVLGADNELGPQQTDRPAPYQQYKCIKEMELRVSSPLTESQDAESKEWTTTGTATTYPSFIPNKGDMFLADIGDGREGVFTVTRAERKTHLKDALYTIEYQLKGYATAEARADLNKKSIQTFRYVGDFQRFGQNPLLTQTDYDAHLEFGEHYKLLLENYMHDFFSIERKTLLVPDQIAPAYDPFVVKAFLSWVTVDEHPNVARIRQLNVSADAAFDVTTMWDCLNDLNERMLTGALFKTQLLYSETFRSVPHLNGIYYGGVHLVVYPKEHRTDVDAAYAAAVVPGGQAIREGGRRFRALDRNLISPESLDLSYTPAVENLPDIVPVTQDDYYVFTEAFYKHRRFNDPLSSHLERVVMQTIREEAIDKVALQRLCTNAMQWANLERFYYVPALLAVLRVVLRNN